MVNKLPIKCKLKKLTCYYLKKNTGNKEEYDIL